MTYKDINDPKPTLQEIMTAATILVRSMKRNPIEGPGWIEQALACPANRPKAIGLICLAEQCDYSAQVLYDIAIRFVDDEKHMVFKGLECPSDEDDGELVDIFDADGNVVLTEQEIDSICGDQLALLGGKQMLRMHSEAMCELRDNDWTWTFNP